MNVKQSQIMKTRSDPLGDYDGASSPTSWCSPYTPCRAYTMKISTTIVTVIFLLGISLSTWVVAQDTSPKDPYSGDILSRSTLTGDWWGTRNQLADKGVTFDLSVTQVGQGVVTGGKSGVWEYGGRGDMVMNVDTGKLGLWPGGFFNLEVEGNWASSVNSKTGALMPVNSNQL